MSKRKPPLVYITGPWELGNPVDFADAAACESDTLHANCCAVSAYLMLNHVLNPDDPDDQAFYRAVTNELISRSHDLVVCGNRRNEIVNADIKLALSMNIPVVTKEGLISAQNKGG